MEWNEAKFECCFTMLLLAGIFITLSVPAAVAEATTAGPRRCYWCGPLADEVHRSRRSAPCSQENNYWTICESNTPYCAIVATAPPFAESRLCVKVYQDECYPQLCNTTKTWKMTCPCKDNLCNAYIDDREQIAFSNLRQLVEGSIYNNNARIKKSAPVLTSQFIGEGNRSKNNDTSAEHLDNVTNNTLNQINILYNEMNKESISNKTNNAVKPETITIAQSINEDMKQNQIDGHQEGAIKTAYMVSTTSPVQDTTRQDSMITNMPKVESPSNIPTQTQENMSTTTATLNMMHSDKAAIGGTNNEKASITQQANTLSTMMMPPQMSKKNVATRSTINQTIIVLVVLLKSIICLIY